MEVESGSSTPPRRPSPVLPNRPSKRLRKRGPYKQYLLPGSQTPIPRTTQWRQKARPENPENHDDEAASTLITDAPDCPTSQDEESSQDQGRCDLSSDDMEEIPESASVQYDTSSDLFVGYGSSDIGDDSSEDARSRTSSMTSSDQGTLDGDGSGIDLQATEAASSFTALFQDIIGEQAKAHFVTAGELAPELYEPHYNQALLLEEAGDLQGCARAASQCSQHAMGKALLSRVQALFRAP